jgi:hypothetical protein
MARTISWLPRLHKIRKTVGSSVRSHYTRADIEQLFELQPSTASALMRLLPVTPVGTANLVEREAVAGFLDRVRAAEDVPALFETIRQEKAGVSRRKIRFLKQRDLDPMSLYGIPDTLKLSRGHLEIDYGSMEELAKTLVTLALILQDDFEEFVRLYEPAPAVEGSDESEDLEELYGELEALERQGRPA